MSGVNRYFILNKPYDMVSQFKSSHDVGLLGDIDFPFPEGIHAIGRLDNHSEGLLILTTNKKVTKLLFESAVPHKRTYLVQVKDNISTDTLHQLRTGVQIRIKGGVYYTTTPCDVKIVQKPDYIIDREADFNATIPHTWLTITLTEGKYHQVRKMVGVLKHRCRRLIRTSIEDLELGDLQPEQVKELDEKIFFEKLKIDYPLIPAAN